MVEIVWRGSDERVPEELSDSEDIDIRVVSESDEAVDIVADADCVVSEDESGGVEMFSRVREESPDTSCILFSDVPPSQMDVETEVIFNYVMGDDPESLANLVHHTIEEKTQTSYPLPDNEEERLRELGRYDLEDSYIAGTFERMTEAAAWSFDAEYAFVSILEDNIQELVSCYGMDMEPIDRENTVCTYNIVTEGVMVVEDLTEDPRFQNNEILNDAGMEFYAGVPIAPTGTPIGTLCVMDTETRTFDKREREILQLFAQEVGEKLRLWLETEIGRDGEDV